MTDDDAAELDALTRERFARPEARARMFAEDMALRREAARRTAEPPPVTIIPMPEFPRFGVARFACPRGCGWGHEEPTDPGPTRLILSAKPGADPGASRLADLVDLDEMSAAMTLEAESRQLAFRARVSAAIEDHYTRMH